MNLLFVTRSKKQVNIGHPHLDMMRDCCSVQEYRSSAMHISWPYKKWRDYVLDAVVPPVAAGGPPFGLREFVFIEFIGFA